MLINNIEYCVTLFLDTKSGERIEELNFSDFYEVNRFIRENKKDGYQVWYTFREIIEGEPDNCSWEEAMEWRELSEEEIQFKINDYLRWIEQDKEHWNNFEQYSRELHYFETNCDYNAKRSRLNEFVYVCPRCMRELEHCHCKHYPNYLVQIDRLILPIIRELNLNGYVTKYCCAGHPSIDEPMQIYISFDREYHFDMPFPVGGKYSKLRHSLYYCPPENMPKEEYAAFQERVIEELTEWAEMLLPVDDEDWID